VTRKTDDGKTQWCQSDERVFSEFVQVVNNVPNDYSNYSAEI
jgi:pyoverdine/dityrosine biosynthesis protein Dit1